MKTGGEEGTLSVLGVRENARHQGTAEKDVPGLVGNLAMDRQSRTLLPGRILAPSVVTGPLPTQTLAAGVAAKHFGCEFLSFLKVCFPPL